MSCPIVNTIKEIKGASWYTDDPEYNEKDVIIMGGFDETSSGSSHAVAYVCDNAKFHLIVAKMDLARLELQQNIDVYRRKFLSDYKPFIGKDYGTAYTYLVDTILGPYLYNQFVDIVDRLAQMEELLSAKIDVMSRKNQPINISIPDIIFLPNVDVLIKYDPVILEKTINRVVDYVNKININSIIAAPISINIPHFEKFSDRYSGLDMDELINVNDEFEKIKGKITCEDYIKVMKKILYHKEKILNYVVCVEEYQCAGINHIGKIHQEYKKIIEALV